MGFGMRDSKRVDTEMDLLQPIKVGWDRMGVMG